MYNVTKDVFYKYIKENNLKEIPGEWTHSSHYINNEGEKKAYMESSSYSYDVKCQIDIPEEISFKESPPNLLGKMRSYQIFYNICMAKFEQLYNKNYNELHKL